MRIAYNAPFVLTFMLTAIAIMAWTNVVNPLFTEQFFMLHPEINLQDPLFYWRLFSHVLGHENWDHLISNGTFILLIGPYLEEKYGSANLLFMSLLTALFTALVTILFFPSYLLGASGVVFMMILLGSFTNVKSGHIPLTFILILVLFLGKEILTSFQDDNISQLAHIVGGVCGSIFGFVLNKRR